MITAMKRMMSEVRGDIPDFLNGSTHFFSLNQEGSNFNLGGVFSGFFECETTIG